MKINHRNKQRTQVLASSLFFILLLEQFSVIWCTCHTTGGVDGAPLVVIQSHENE